MSKRKLILMGMAVGFGWSLALIWLGTQVLTLSIGLLLPSMGLAFIGPGLFLALLIARIAQRRFFDEDILDGEPLTGAALIDQRVLANTVEQIALALCLWPAIGFLTGGAGPGLIITLGWGFLLARLAFWIGYHISPPLRSFGFAASFYPTLLAFGWAVWLWLT